MTTDMLPGNWGRCDPSGRMLVAANLRQMSMRDGDTVTMRPATLSTYRIGADGRLTYVRSYDIEPTA